MENLVNKTGEKVSPQQMVDHLINRYTSAGMPETDALEGALTVTNMLLKNMGENSGASNPKGEFWDQVRQILEGRIAR